ncbi:bifunctional tetrahydrofolate synthase/dihydrofolate synthase [Nitrosomonas sp.]|uniref:bifunctional tetrahydrofolate synthase/dihydrofolate synthase n=1 Tax=Nitrosomonas sp. TaxID=42353 RepID=UPI0025E56BDF|nr:bifunctional tetrahydrofolate synthase/dihydrofolate synthase [Nitrosomonas sp.]MCC6917018.1 bifunctional tetrahydrofolate synthase/dihydrofolate synthase [Nitrosomonas sp.]
MMDIRLSTLEDWLSYLEKLHPKTIDMGLERVKKVRDTLGLKPEFPVITVAGTNGKGSVCTMLESILNHASYRVGCYTSPHLLRYNERIRISQREISDEALCEVFAEIEAARELTHTTLTYFEFGTLAAMLLFLRSRIDVAILEVGLGGRLDAVNVFDADCAILTSIDLDHMEYLGTTREAIGQEKIGIFRENRPAICAEPEIPGSLYKKMLATNANLYCIGEAFSYVADNQQWCYRGISGHRQNLPLPALKGRYQLQNASAVLAALETLEETLPVPMDAVRRGLVDTALPGRFQMISARPIIILDVAHNPAAARKLSASLESMPVKGCTYAVAGMLGDKDMTGTLGALKKNIDYWLIARLDVARGASEDEMMQALKEAGIEQKDILYTFQNVWSAYVYARDHAGDNDRICVFGSFYTVSSVMRGLEGLHS